MKRALSGLALAATIASPAMADYNMETYLVTVSNATSHHVITPPVAVTHRADYSLFEVGSAASEGLITQAETGSGELIAVEAQSSNDVFDVVATSNYIPYGSSFSFEITAPRQKARLSLTGMLATTNDGFAALNGVQLPKKQGRYFAYAYDAGSEMNNELCSHIPGPPCPELSGNDRTTGTGEGFVTLHNGIQGGGDLNPKHMDWRGPVAVITITRMEH